MPVECPNATLDGFWGLLNSSRNRPDQSVWMGLPLPRDRWSGVSSDIFESRANAQFEAGTRRMPVPVGNENQHHTLVFIGDEHWVQSRIRRKWLIMYVEGELVGGWIRWRGCFKRRRGYVQPPDCESFDWIDWIGSSTPQPDHFVRVGEGPITCSSRSFLTTSGFVRIQSATEILVYENFSK